MSQAYGKSYGGSLAESYEKYFVPRIGRPVAEDLIEAAGLRPGERVLDVACGTGIVARLAAERVGGAGSVDGLDINAGMLEVARSSTPSGVEVSWYETSAEAMPLSDETYDVVLCQMGLQFMEDKHAALGEMRRVLVPGGRLLLNLPGPTPGPFDVMAEALARYVRAEAAGFVHAVFSLADPGEIGALLRTAGLRGVEVQSEHRVLHVPEPEQFLWEYVHSTPLANLVEELDEDTRAAFVDAVGTGCKDFATDDGMSFSVRMSTARGTR